MRERLPAALLLALIACTPEAPRPSAEPPAPQGSRSDSAGIAAPATVRYSARLFPLNAAASGSETTGEARFALNGDSLTVRVDVEGAAPGIAHWQHIHGFRDSRDAVCPTPAADVNGDGIIDLIETEPVSGTTMVPFNAHPVELAIPEESYPTAAADGSYTYEATLSLSALNAAMARAYDGQQLDLARRVVFIHGVPTTRTLPASVASLGTIPASTTIPIACGKIEVLTE